MPLYLVRLRLNRVMRCGRRFTTALVLPEAKVTSGVISGLAKLDSCDPFAQPIALIGSESYRIAEQLPEHIKCQTPLGMSKVEPRDGM